MHGLTVAGRTYHVALSPAVAIALGRLLHGTRKRMPNLREIILAQELFRLSEGLSDEKAM